jgi:DNA-directed RNA polymerase specialized sigma24 family protein
MSQLALCSAGPVRPTTVTVWIQQLVAGEQAVLQRLWEAYYPRLVALARKKLQGAPRQMANEEDAVNNAFYSFHRGVEQGRFPRLADRHDLWQVLVMLTVRKASNQARDARAQKAGGGRVRNASALDRPGEDEGRAFADLIDREPDPAVAVEVADECRRLLALLPNDSLRQVAVWKMEGRSNQEIATLLGRSVSRVEAKLADIRKIWEKRARG